MKRRVDIFIGSLGGGGAERVCVTIANGFVHRGIDVRLVVLNLKNSVYHKSLDKRVEIINFNKRHTRNSIICLFHYCKNEKPKSILVFNHQIAIILVLLKKVFNMPLKIVARNINTLSLKSQSQKRFWHKYIVNKLVKSLYSKVDLLVAQSEGMRKDLIDNYKFTASKIVVVNNPVSEVIEKSVITKKKCNNKLNKEIIFVGRLTEQKGLYYLIEAYEICLKRMSDITLTIVGKGPLEESLKKIITDKGLDKTITFRGFCENIELLYLNADITVLSSLYEGFPNVLVESITLGTPIVAFDCPSGPSEIIKDGLNGFLAKYKDSEDLANKIYKALNYDWDYDEIKKTGLSFSRRTIINKYIDIVGVNNYDDESN